MGLSKEFSYTSASAVPLKIFLNQDLVQSITERGFIPPYHIQLNPTAKCNESCPWCSCSRRDLSKELTLEEIGETFRIARAYGTRAATMTGDGEPLMHPSINEMVTGIKGMGIDIGISTNGWFLNRLTREALESITWVRVSLGDQQLPKPRSWWDGISRIAETSKIDVSFSYVLTSDPEIELIEKMMRFANEHELAHVRILNEITHADELTHIIGDMRERIRRDGIDDRLVIWQDRSVWTRGAKECYISILKPVLGTDGYWYGCCGSQYMREKADRRYVMPMGEYRCADGLREMVENQRFFDGSMCAKCYYSDYNYFLKALLKGIKHLSFV